MTTVLYIIIGCCFISIMIIIHDILTRDNFIKNYAKKHTIEEIEEMISEEEKLIESGKFKGIMLEDMLDRKEFLETIKKFKIERKI